MKFRLKLLCTRDLVCKLALDTVVNPGHLPTWLYDFQDPKGIHASS